ncbi:SDR family NAD(P)-dependent oxidoreductase [Robbsia sp. KACC 23696]|uniref:SDR family oxidoreductase n=1 Tax=Robbsia sp. KACC 23696 TaxID=3149231 RepID=UPI00325A9818
MNATGNTILITGGSSGIGLEMARQLLARRNTVIITGRDAARLASAQEALPGVHCFQSDVTDPEAIVALHASVIAAFPALNVLINNAGVMRKIDLQDPANDVSTIGKEIETNLLGPVRMVQQYLPHLLAQKRATIVNVSSGLAFVPMAVSPVYCATKAALHSYSQSLRLQLAGTSVEVVEVAPPLTETPLGDAFTKEDTAGVKSMDVAELARHAIEGCVRGTKEVKPGLSRALYLLGRVAPSFGAKQLGKSVAAMRRG